MDVVIKFVFNLFFVYVASAGCESCFGGLQTIFKEGRM